MAKKVADLLVDVLAEAGVRQIYVVSDDSLNGITDSIRAKKGPGARVSWSGRADSNRGPPAPKAGALPGCATPRQGMPLDSKALSNSIATPTSQIASNCAETDDITRNSGSVSGSCCATRSIQEVLRPRTAAAERWCPCGNA
jgi:hypothetical protein